MSEPVETSAAPERAPDPAPPPATRGKRPASKRIVVLESAMAGIMGTVGAKIGSRLFENEILGAVVGGIAAGLTSIVVLRVARRR